MQTFKIFNNEPDVRLFPKGQTLFSEGQTGDGLMYAVLEGEVEIVRQNKVLDTVQPGGVFGEMALLDQQPRAATAIAKTDCMVATINEQRFTRLVGQNPYFALDLMRLLVTRVRANLGS